MRKAKLYQLLAVASGLSVAVASAPAFAKPAANVDHATLVTPTAGSATVDGDTGEWDTTAGSADFSANMCTAGSIGADGNCEGNGKVQLSTMYSRYDCSTETMYVLVLATDGNWPDKSESDAWVKIYNLSQSPQVDGNSSTFSWVSPDGVEGSTLIGYEASFQLAAGSYDDVQVHLNVDGNTSSTGKNGDTMTLTVEGCEVPPVTGDDDDDDDDDDTPPVTGDDDDDDDDTPPVTGDDDDDDDDTSPVTGDDDDDDNGNPNMACEEITGSNGVPMSLVAKYETNDNGEYVFEKGTDIISITDADLSGGTWSVEGGVVKVGAIIVKGGTVALADEDGNNSFSNAGLVNNGGQIADISNVQFCEVPVFDSKDAEVCLWSADKDKDGQYINVEEIGCIDAEEGKFYAIEAGGEFSSALEAE